MSYTYSICTDSLEITTLEKFYSQFAAGVTNEVKFNFKGDRFYKVMLEDKIIGFGSIDERYSDPDFKRFIHPEHRSQGIGGKLLDYIIEDAKKLKKNRLTGMFKGNNENVVRFFTSKGFEVTSGEKFSMAILKLK